MICRIMPLQVGITIMGKWLKIFNVPYRCIFHSPSFYLEKELKNCRELLDMGCGRNSPVYSLFAGRYMVGVELFRPYILESRNTGIHSEYIMADIRSAEFVPDSFDVVLAWDVLEHLTKEEGYQLICKMEKIAKNRVVIFTPNGYISQSEYDENTLQTHKSGWSVDDFREIGYKVQGMNGIKSLRKEKAAIRFKPSIFWNLLSDISQKVTFYYPRHAFQLLAVKEV